LATTYQLGLGVNTQNWQSAHLNEKADVSFSLSVGHLGAKISWVLKNVAFEQIFLAQICGFSIWY
jgi:hypothetical protein